MSELFQAEGAPDEVWEIVRRCSTSKINFGLRRLRAEPDLPEERLNVMVLDYVSVRLHQPAELLSCRAHEQWDVPTRTGTHGVDGGGIQVDGTVRPQAAASAKACSTTTE
jgi:hypothetical protein